MNSTMLLATSISILFAAIAAQNGQDCGLISSPEHPDRIVGGIAVGLSEPVKFPFLAILTHPGQSSPVCGGVLITPLHVLTAAHCFDPEQNLKNQFIVSLSLNNWCEPQELREDHKVAKVHIHEAYTGIEHYNDIAIIQLMERTNLPRVCLPKQSTKLNDHNGLIAGWGRVSQNNATLPCNLRFAALTRFTLEQCTKSRLPSKDAYEPTIFCAGNETIDTCQGDSGGPFLTKTKGGTRFIVSGVTSSGFGCAKRRLPGLYTNVGLYTEWIALKTQTTLRNVEHDGARMLYED